MQHQPVLWNNATSTSSVEQSNINQFCGTMQHQPVLWNKATSTSSVEQCNINQFCGTMQHQPVLWNNAPSTSSVEQCNINQFCGTMQHQPVLWNNATSSQKSTNLKEIIIRTKNAVMDIRYNIPGHTSYATSLTHDIKYIYPAECILLSRGRYIFIENWSHNMPQLYDLNVRV